jgi:hypothetical protein
LYENRRDRLHPIFFASAGFVNPAGNKRGWILSAGLMQRSSLTLGRKITVGVDLENGKCTTRQSLFSDFVK